MRKTSRGVVGAIVLVAIIFALAAYGGYFLLNGDGNKHEGLTNIKNILTPDEPIPTAFPFRELTIPYLKSRDYQSELGDLKEISSNAKYTSYFTSYNSDGLTVNGLLTIPKGDAPDGGWPAVVFLHGYIPPQQYQTLVNYVSYVDYLAARGLVVFKIDYRGHGNSEGEAYGGYYSGDYVIDTLNAYSALKNSDFVNSEQIGIWGHSMSGNVAFRSFIALPEIKKAVIWAGAVYTYEDFSQFSISDRSYQPPATESARRNYRIKLGETYGAFDANSEFWKQVPATNFLEGKVGEIQVHHAVDDPVVEIGYSRNLMSILDGTSVGHELFEYSSGGHNLVGDSFTKAMQRSVDFFKN